MINSLNALPVKDFPLNQDSFTPIEACRDIACHCEVGSAYQFLYACGVRVDKEVPWLRPRLLSYQMADGGLSCDNEAYLVKDETPSSMVGTVARDEEGRWTKNHPAGMFPLLNAVNVAGEISPYLTRQWEEVRAMMARRIAEA